MEKPFQYKWRRVFDVRISRVGAVTMVKAVVFIAVVNCMTVTVLVPRPVV